MSLRTPLGILLALASLGAPAPAVERRELTFFVASDSHFGAPGMSEANLRLVEQMNTLPGTEYPPEVGGRVEAPRGVLFTGDTTDNGLLPEFAEFEKVYGRDGGDGLLRYPVFESIGNHDVTSTSPIKERARARHGGINYSWQWDGIRFACLDMYPDVATRAWLAGELQPLRPEHPLVLFFHVSLEGPYSDYWGAADKDAFAQAIEGRNVLAIFHGHEHRTGRYEWRGHQVFRPGSPRHSSHSFLAVRVGATTMSVAAWDFDQRRWLWWSTVPVRR
jgi:Calcineurin-like phosphoesterase